ncbi:MAG: hydroxyacid dehydrogenase, partial [Anaerolineales bacterium]|nr:hydroxyacid dehydrogenase [Anaerolineales bacterium]
MPNWKILLTDGLHEDGQALLRAAAQVEDCMGIAAQELLDVIAAYDALIVRSRTKVGPPVFEAGRRLRVIGRAGVGVDNIDLASATQHGVKVVNAPLSSAIAVAELTLGLMFSLARAIPRADAATKTGKWIKAELEGSELSGKVLGIIGMGSIGSAVAQRAAALGMRVLGYDPALSAATLQERGTTPTPLEALYAQADFISLHVPLTPETHHLITGQSLGYMKRGVRLICTARGGLIDETALLGALETGQVAGVALDVFAQEP